MVGLQVFVFFCLFFYYMHVIIPKECLQENPQSLTCYSYDSCIWMKTKHYVWMLLDFYVPF